MLPLVLGLIGWGAVSVVVALVVGPVLRRAREADPREVTRDDR